MNDMMNNEDMPRLAEAMENLKSLALDLDSGITEEDAETAAKAAIDSGAYKYVIALIDNNDPIAAHCNYKNAVESVMHEILGHY